MHILNLEDNVFKHHDICRAIERGSFENLKIDCVGNLADGLSKIEGAISKGKLYDLIITDMWYPEKSGGADNNSGEILIKEVRERGWDVPIILCTSVNYCYPGILGSIHYSEKEDWETELVKLIRKL